MGQGLFRCTVVGQITPSFPGDIELAAQLFIALQQRYKSALLRGRKRRHHTGGAAADHD